ncbi:MAG: cyclase family protein [Anaerolineae bacterium]
MPLIYDISLPISAAMPVWPGDPRIRVDPVSSIRHGNACNISRLEMGTHTLTHVDAPRHITDRGLAVNQLPLNLLIGPALVVEPRLEGNLITATDLGELGIRGSERLLIKTRNSDLWMGGPYDFESDFVALSRDAAHWLIARGIKLVGVDYLSVEAFDAQDDMEVHRALLEEGVIILEGLNLSQVPEGRYQLICLPLKVQDGDGAPARVVLMR